jgi:DNA-directed DNA polymerase III PolC
MTESPFAELAALSNFTFLTGASHPEEMMHQAARLGLPAVAIADINSVAGIVRAHAAAREISREAAERLSLPEIGPPAPPGLSAGWQMVCPRLIPAATLVFEEGIALTALPENRQGWANLCRLLTEGKRHATKGDCRLHLTELFRFSGGLQFLLHPPFDALDGIVTRPRAPWPTLPKPDWLPHAERLARQLPNQMHLLLVAEYDGKDKLRQVAQIRLAEQLGLPPLASARPLMHDSTRRKIADVLSAVRLGKTVERLGIAALPNAELRLRSDREMRRLFRDHQTAVDAAARLAARLTFSLDELRYEYPSEIAEGETPTERLRRLTYKGLKDRYPTGGPDRVLKQIEHELSLIAQLKFEPYFLTVNDIVAFARSRGILCQGRGSAANSVVCFCLGVTSVSPEVGTMVFERFISEARNEPPDIDVDFEHERREEVIQWIYERYGRHRAGLCATVIHYRAKRAVREVGQALGLSREIQSMLSSQIWGFGSGMSGLEPHRLHELGLDPTEPRLVLALELIAEIIGFPRHLSQHVGGFIITEGRLDELVPIENASMEDRTVICWDKDDIDTLGILKVDILALGMLTCIRKSFDLLAMHKGVQHSLASLPPEDPAVYSMLGRADTVGVFQVESRAQMNFLPRMRPRCFYDLVIEVAIIRPGPIQGDMVHPYIRRRNGEEPVSFPSDELGRVLGKTLGVPLFQEQAMQIAIIGAGFTPTEADRLRRSLATFKKHGNVSEFRDRFLKGMARNGYEQDFAERCFSQIEGFGSYGFPESHAASFALLVYASAWIKRHHPGIFACALLNSQPMGFYAPAQIIRDAREHGVEVRPITINESYYDNILEPDGKGGLALRLGFRQLKGMGVEDAAWLAEARGNGYRSVQDVWRRAGVSPIVLYRLAEADAFACLGMSRREALWEARGIVGEKPLPLFAYDIDGESIIEPEANLPKMGLGEEVVEDYISFRFSLRAHPLALLRPRLTAPKGAVWPTSAPVLPRNHAPERSQRESHGRRTNDRGAGGGVELPTGP